MKITAVVSLVFLCAFWSCKKQLEKTPYTGPRVGHTYNVVEIAGFKEITVKGEFNDGYIKKLPKTTLIWLADTVYTYMSNVLDSIINDINVQAGGFLTLQRTTDSASSLIQVHLTDSATYKLIEPNADISSQRYEYDILGLVYPRWTSDNIINHESVFVDMKKTTNDHNYQQYILRHEMMHALGFFGHEHMAQFYTSVISVYPIAPFAHSFSSFDNTAIQLLYDPAVQAGMDEAALDALLAH